MAEIRTDSFEKAGASLPPSCRGTSRLHNPHLPAQIDHFLGIVLRLCVHHTLVRFANALVQQEIWLIVPPRLRLVQIVDSGDRADLVAIGQGQHEIRVEQAAVLIQRLRALDAKQLFREGIVVEADPCQRVVAPVVDI